MLEGTFCTDNLLVYCIRYYTQSVGNLCSDNFLVDSIHYMKLVEINIVLRQPS
jgi:hypothetical protein